MNLGKLNINKLYAGSVEIEKIYLGTTTIYEKGGGGGGGGIDADTILCMHFDDNLTDSSLYSVPQTASLTSIYDIGKFSNCVTRTGGEATYAHNNKSKFVASQEATIDFWMKKQDASNDCYLYLNSGNGWSWWMSGNDFKITNMPIFDSVQSSTISLSDIASGDFFHIAFVYEPNTYSCKIYINGTLKDTVSVGTSGSYEYYFNSILDTFKINNWVAIDELRISCVARWDTDFTPPTQPYS